MGKRKYMTGNNRNRSLTTARSIGTLLAVNILFIVAFESFSEGSTTTVKEIHSGAEHVRISRQSWLSIRVITMETMYNTDTTINNIDDIFRTTDVPNLEYIWYEDRDSKANDCKMCAASWRCFFGVIQKPCFENARSLKADVSIYLVSYFPSFDFPRPLDDFPRPLDDFPRPPDDFPRPLDDFPRPLDDFPIPLDASVPESAPENTVRKPRFLSLLSSILNLRSKESLYYNGNELITEGGSWKELPDGRLAQTDDSASIAAAMLAAGIPGKAEYSFELSYIGGLDDNAIGFGVIVPGFAMGLVWDPVNWGGFGWRAQVYNADGDLHQYGGTTYDLEISAEHVERINAEMVVNKPLEVRIRVDFSNGDVWIKDPFDSTTWWAFTLGRSLEEYGHNMIGFGTISGAASFDKFSATPHP